MCEHLFANRRMCEESLGTAVWVDHFVGLHARLADAPPPLQERLRALYAKITRVNVDAIPAYLQLRTAMQQQ